MAVTYIIFSDTSDRQISSFGTGSYAVARTGSESLALQGLAATNSIVGQILSAGNYFVYEWLVAFDTSVIPDAASITSATLALDVFSDSSTQDYTIEAYLKDWGTAVDTGDWVAGENLSALTLAASLSTASISGTAYQAFTESGTNLRDGINNAGLTRLLLASSRTRTGDAPTATLEQTNWVTADEAGTTEDPKLTIVDNTPAWNFVSVGTAAEVASGNLTLNEPSGAASGDLLVACIAYRSNAAFTLPAGWALVATQQSSGDTDATNGIASGVMAYIVRGGSAPSYAFTRTAGDVARGAVVAYRDNSPSPYDTGSANTLAVASATVTTGTFNTAQAGELIVAMVACGDTLTTSAFDAATDPATASGATDTTTEPTAGTWIERLDSSTGTGADTAIAIADAVRATAGATGTIQATVSAIARHVMIAGAFRLRVLSSLVYDPFPMMPYLVR